MNLVSIEPLDGNRYRVELVAGVDDRSRHISVTLVGRSVADVQASDGAKAFIGSAGNPELTQEAIHKATETVTLLAAFRSIFEKDPRWSR